MQTNNAGFKSDPDTNVKTLMLEIDKIFYTAQEGARKTHESIQNAVTKGLLVAHCQANQPDITSEVHEMYKSDMRNRFHSSGRPLADITKETNDEMANDQSDIELHVYNIEDNTETVIRDNLDRFESYISDCVKTTDLIMFLPAIFFRANEVRIFF